MADRRDLLSIIAVGGLAAAAGVYFAPGGNPDTDPGAVAALFGATVHDLEGRPLRLLEWKGRILVCNFWATWCAPCREEIPALGRLRTKMSAKGLEIVGIAIDQAANVSEFVKALKVVYPVVLADAGGIELMRRLGNSAGGLPFTVVLDRQGRVAYRRLGQIVEADLERELASIV